MGSARMLFIGRVSARAEPYFEAMKKHCVVEVATSGKRAIAMIPEVKPQYILLDAASMRTPGERICRDLRGRFPEIPVIHIYPEDYKPADDSPADVTLNAPVTARKLNNVIERMVTAKHEETIQCGPYTMNVPRRILMVNGSETQLTPKQAELLAVFLRNPNRTFDRKTLMETIWDTDYMGDTRTLDVHIRWVRRALENDGLEPRYLRTIRGIGYRLELPTNGNGHHAYMPNPAR